MSTKLALPIDGGSSPSPSDAMVAPVEEPAESCSLKEVAKAASYEAEKQLILKVLSRTRGNRKKAALELQISYKALLYKLKRLTGQPANGNGR